MGLPGKENGEKIRLLPVGPPLPGENFYPLSVRLCNKCLTSTQTHRILPGLETHLRQTSSETPLQMHPVSREKDALRRLCKRLPSVRMVFSDHKKAPPLPAISREWFHPEHRAR